MKTILIRVPIDQEEPVTINTSGFNGDACLEATKNIEAAIGKVTKRDPKPEMYEDGQKQSVTAKA